MPLKVLRGERRYSFLVSMILLELILFPLISEAALRSGALALIHTGILVTAVHAISESRRALIIGLVLAAPVLVRAWAVVLPNETPTALDTGGLLMTAALYGYVAVIVLKDVMGRAESTPDALMGGICTYLLAGYAFAVLYVAIWNGNPGAFSVDMANTFGEPDTPRFAYFSFVTLTTLGYGDISPVDPRAQTLAILEAITGVVYLATFVSRLVSDQRK